MLFKDVIGNASIKERLKQAARENRISHALLFAGSEGCGNLPMAIAFAQYISCPERTEDDSCGKCPSCLKFDKLSHPDLHFSYPVVTRKSGEKPRSVDFLPEWREALAENPFLSLNHWLMRLDAENKQGNINVEECHDIIRKLSFKCYEAPYKFLIMWMPEFLGTAGNTILKIVEEPPDNTLFIFVAQNPGKIINTITSRTQLIRFNRITDEEMRENLKLSYNLGDTEAAVYARLADGNYAAAKELAESADEEIDHGKSFLEWMRECYSIGKSAKILIERIEVFSKSGRERQKSFIAYAIDMLRECLLMNMKQDNLIRLLEEEMTGFQKFSAFIHPDNVGDLIEELSKAYYHLERNANAKILMLDLSFRIHHLLKRKAAAQV